MLKKIFSVLCMAAVIILAAQSQAFAAKVAVILDAPTGTFTEPEKVYSMVETSLGKILKNSSEYEIVSPADTENYVQIYREEHDMIMSTGADEGQHEEKWLKKRRHQQHLQLLRRQLCNLYSRDEHKSEKFYGRFYQRSKNECCNGFPRLVECQKKIFPT